MHLYLVRHGQSHVNLADLTVAHRDAPLTELGQEQARRVSEWISDSLTITDFYASTVARAWQTATTIGAALGMQPIPDNRIREIGTCRPDGTPIPEGDLEPFTPDLWGTLDPYTPVTATGESWMQFRSRVGSFLEFLVPHVRPGHHHPPSVLEDTRRVLVVAHAGVIEAVFEYIFEKGPWSVVAVETHHTGVTKMEHQPQANRPDWWLHYHNLTHHLTSAMRT